MNNSFYGNSLLQMFPRYSRIRKDYSSVGSKYFFAIGTDIERVHSNVFQGQVGTDYSLADQISTLDSLQFSDLTEDSTYNEQVSGKTVTKVVKNDVEISRSMKDFYCAFPKGFIWEETLSDITNVIAQLGTGSPRHMGNIDLDEEIIIFIDVKKITSCLKTARSASIKFCGKAKNGTPIEESIIIKDEGLYKTQERFRSLTPLEKDEELDISGGFSIEVNGLVDFEIDVLASKSQNFFEASDKRKGVNSFRKRLVLDGYRSFPKEKNINFQGALNQNDLMVELVRIDDQSFLYYYHRYFGTAVEYKSEENINFDDGIFEELIGFTELVGENSEPLKIADIDFDSKRNSLIACTLESNVFYYEIGVPVIKENIIKRTSEVPIAIDTDDDFLASEDSTTVRLIGNNLDRPIGVFIVVKLEDGVFEFLTTEKIWGENPAVFVSIQEFVDLQDSLQPFSFEVDMMEKDIELFVYSFNYNSNNSNVLAALNEPDANHLMELSKLTNTNINSRVITCSKTKPIISYDPLIVPSNPNIQNIYIKGNAGFVCLRSEDMHHKYKPIYEQYIYSNDKIYGTEAVQGEFVFHLASGDEVTIDV